MYAEPEFPNLLFAKDGEIYHLEGRTAMAIGGAYSTDKYYRLANRPPWFESEQPDDAIEAFVEVQLDRADWQVDYIFSRTVPLRYEPGMPFLTAKRCSPLSWGWSLFRKGVRHRRGQDAGERFGELYH